MIDFDGAPIGAWPALAPGPVAAPAVPTDPTGTAAEAPPTAGAAAAVPAAPDLGEATRCAHQAVLTSHALVQELLALPATPVGARRSALRARPDRHRLPAAGLVGGQPPLGLLLRGVLAALDHPGPGAVHQLAYRVHTPLTGPDLTVTGSAAHWSVELAGRALLTGSAATRPELTERPEPRPERHPRDWHPLAATDRRELGPRELELLALGSPQEVFGPAHRLGPGNQDLRPPAGPARLPRRVRIEPTGGRYGYGRLSADLAALTGVADLVEAGHQLAQVYALHQGLHLLLTESRFQPLPDRPVSAELLTDAVGHPGLLLAAEVREIGLVPRPHLVLDLRLLRAGGPVGALDGLGLEIREQPGVAVDPSAVVLGEREPHRVGPTGRPAPVHELHLAHSAEGDLTVVAGPAAGLVSASVRPRLPRGGMLLVSRVTEYAQPGYRPGARLVNEVDLPAGAWYHRENHSPSTPNLVYLESSLQAAAMLGSNTGIALEYPDQDFVCRNLEGRARLRSQRPLRGRTLTQTSTLLSHTELPGALLQRYAYQQYLGDHLVYEGESTHGYFLAELLLTEQQGLDGGREVPPWLERERPGGLVELDLAALRAAPGPLRLGTGRLQLFDRLWQLPAGGHHGQGCLLVHREVDPEDWFFAQHFMNDPVMPGSASIEMLYEALRAHVLASGLAEGIPEPYFALSTETELAWKYRGQVLREHELVTGELHVTSVRREADRLLVRADGGVWRDGLRIYQVDGLGLEVRSGVVA